MIHAALLTIVAVAFPPGYVEAFSEARAQNKPAFVLLTMDGCAPCQTAKTLEPTLRQHGSFVTVNVSRDRLLGRKLLAKTSGVPQLLACQWDGKKWAVERFIGLQAIQEIANGIHARQEPPPNPVGGPSEDKPLLEIAVPAIRPSPGTSSALLNDLLSRNRRATGETESGSQAHYATHFINSEVRNRWKFDSAVYLGGGKAYLLNDVPVTLAMVSQIIPQSFRSSFTYKAYVVEAQRTPVKHYANGSFIGTSPPLTSSLLDEWSAYLASTQAQAELRGDSGAMLYDCMCSLNMMVFSFAACQRAESGDKTWLPATKRLVRIMANRTSEVCQHAYAVDPASYRARIKPYIQTLRNAPDAEQLRQYIRKVWGEEWTRNLLGF